MLTDTYPTTEVTTQVDHILMLKRHAQQDIAAVLNELEMNTGMLITQLQLHRCHDFKSNLPTHKCTVTLELPAEEK